MGPNYVMTTLFVVPTSNTLLSGSNKTFNLSRTTGQFGLFDNTNTTLDAAGDVTANTKYIQIAQARKEDLNNDGIKLPTKKSGPIYKDKVVDFYKVTASTTSLEQIVKISGFDNIPVQDTVTLSVRLRGDMIDNSYSQKIGILKSLTYQTRCSTCSDEPCTELTADEIETMVDSFVAEGNAEPTLSSHVSFAKEIVINVASAADFSVGEAVTCSTGTGTGTVVSVNVNAITVSTTSAKGTFTGNLVPAVGSASAIGSVVNTGVKLSITAKPVPQYGPNSTWAYTNPFVQDKVTINAYFYQGAPTSMDSVVSNRCVNIATITTTQDPVYPRGLAAQIKEMEVRYHSYQSLNKTIYDDMDWNGSFVSYVDAATYTLYFIEYKTLPGTDWSTTGTEMTATARIAVPTGAEATIEAILEAFLGSFPERY